MRTRYKGMLLGLAYGLTTVSMRLSEYSDWSGELIGYNLSRLLASLALPMLIGTAIGYYLEWRRLKNGRRP